MIVLRFSDYLRERSIDHVVVERKNTKLYEFLDKEYVADPEALNLYRKKIRYTFFPALSKIRKSSINWDALRGSKVSFWVVHPNETFRAFMPLSGKGMECFGYQVVPFIKFLFFHKYRFLKKNLNVFNQKGSLFFMDGATVRAYRYFFKGNSAPNILIPIPTEIRRFNNPVVKNDQKKAEKVAVGYLGRIDAFKFSALRSLIEGDLSQINRKTGLILHLVCQGAYLEKLLKLCDECCIEYIVHGFLPNSKAISTLKENTDICIAMGTSALDIAASGHPCVLIDPALKNRTKPQSSFRLVNEIEEFSLGEFRDFPSYRSGKRKFSEIIQDVQRNAVEYELKMKNYISENHRASLVFYELDKRIKNSKILATDVEGFAKVINRFLKRY